MNQTFTTEALDEAPELTEADMARAIYRVAGKTVDHATWQSAAQARLKKQKISITLDPDAPTLLF